MAQISRFLGIEIHMRYRDHPPAHFHVRYAENRATIAIETMQMTDGALPARVRALARQPLLPIPPLE